MKKTIITLFAAITCSISLSQNITGKLGTNGNFIVTDASGNSNYLIVNSLKNSVGIGSNVFDPVNPEKLLVDCGVTNSVNAIYAKGSINKYFQFNIRNLSSGNQSSTDIVCTANNGTETTYFMNMGINGSGFVYQNGNPIETGKFNDCYVLASGNDLYIVNNNASKDMLFLTGGTSANNERMRIKNNGRIGIGISNPNNLLSLSGGAYSNGSSWVNASDSILKRNIEELTKYGLADIMKMRSVSYYYKSDSTNKLEIGFIAQELKNIIPEVVSGEEGNMGISYGNLLPVMVNAVKEQQGIIEMQRSQLQKQQSQIDIMDEKINFLMANSNQTAGANPTGSNMIFIVFINICLGAVFYLALKRRKGNFS